MNKASILDRSYAYYASICSLTIFGFAISTFAIYYFNNLILLAVACFGFTFFSVQIAGIMHDSGHRAIFEKSKNNDILGYICAFFLAMVYDNWKIRHNLHHARPNQEDEDPDIEFPLLATSKELYQKKKGAEKFLIKFQVFYYYPLGGIISITNRLGASSYFKNKPMSKNWWKILIYASGVFFLFPLPFLIFNLPKALFVLSLVHITSEIYLANCFAPNHKGMPEVKKGMKLSFLEQQIATSRNVQGGVFTDTLLLGLNYQIEHHLFVNCPRDKLKLISPYVKDTCRDLGLEYASVNFVETNKIIIKELRAVSLA